MLFTHFFITLILALAPVIEPQTGNQQDKQQSVQTNTQTKQPPPKPPKKETFLEWVLRVTGISATPSTMKGDDDEISGDVWVFDLNTRTGRRITRDGSYRSPIFLDGEKGLLALKGNDLMEIALDGGEVKRLSTIKGIAKLVGLNVDDRNQVLFVSEDEQQRSSVGLYSLKDGRVTLLSYDLNADGERRMLAHIRGWERVYDDGRIILYTKSETKEGLAGSIIEWSDVYLKKEKQDPVNISNCDGVNCGQPSLSSNARYVTYIKSEAK
jgi:hypothetical protein